MKQIHIETHPAARLSEEQLNYWLHEIESRMNRIEEALSDSKQQQIRPQLFALLEVTKQNYADALKEAALRKLIYKH